MPSWLAENEPLIRLAVFAAVFAVLVLIELAVPRRSLAVGRLPRWPGNLGVVVVDTLVLRMLFPTAAVGVALWCEGRGIGLLAHVPLPIWIKAVVAVLVLDFVIWAQHVAFHHVPVLWRLHRMHHADLDIDVTTGVRFHPIEIVLSMLIKMTTVAALGAPALGVLAFEVLLNATSMFNHANIRLTGMADRVLRWIVVTPEMHRVHHSILRRETDSNFGFNLPWWDRLFGTYRAEPAAGHEAMTIGLPVFRDPAELRLDRMLVQPWRDERKRDAPHP